jgi:hypothetical protein
MPAGHCSDKTGGCKMNLDEAKTLAQAWTTGHDVSLGGWRSVIAVLLSRIEELEGRRPAQTIADIIRETENRAR